MRADRIGVTHQKIGVARDTNVDRILRKARRLEPEILIIDSIQTISTDTINSAAGSIQQVKGCATQLDHFAKETQACVILICQVTKDGQAAGPNTLQHLVDVLLSIDVSDEFPALRWLSTSKNRFGSVLETGCFEMRDDGLHPVEEPREGDQADEPDELLPIAQELAYRLLEAGGEVDPGLRDRIAGRLDLQPRGSR